MSEVTVKNAVRHFTRRRMVWPAGGAEMSWTSEKPTVAGWYWFRTEVTEEEICRIYQDADDAWWATCTEWDEVYKLDDVLIGAEFKGPITPTDRQQGRVEGLREAEKYARACVHERAVTLDGFTGSSAMAGVIRGKQSEAERIADRCHKLTQAAQEGEQST